MFSVLIIIRTKYPGLWSGSFIQKNKPPSVDTGLHASVLCS